MIVRDELKEARIENLASDPTGDDLYAHRIWYNTTDNTLRLYDGSSVKDVSGSLGDIRTSALTEAQFQALNGTGWVLCDGDSCSGTAYETLTGNASVPDLRGEFLRGADNSRGVDSGRALLSTQADATAVNGLHDNGHTHQVDIDNTGGGVPAFLTYTTSGNASKSNACTSTTGYAALDSTDSETRPRNVAVNFFIKVD